MNESEIMHCAAILAAGIIAHDKEDRTVIPEETVELMEQIAEVMTKSQREKLHSGKEWI